MLHLTEVWRQELDRNRIVGVLFIDFKRHLIPFVIKQWLLNSKPVEFQEMCIIADYLSGRKQFVEIEG